MILKPAAALVAAFLIFAAPAFAAGYLKLGDIKGESADARHKDWIEIESFSEGVDQSAASVSAGAARAAGKATLRPVTITKAVDGTTPALREAVLTGKAIKDATIEYGRLTLVLKDVRVLSAASDGQTEEVTLQATQMEWQIAGTLGIKAVSFNAATGKP